MAIIEKTDRLLEKLLCFDFRTSVGIDKAKGAIRKALREQDRDTRHACAGACSTCGGSCHEACINCNDGL